MKRESIVNQSASLLNRCEGTLEVTPDFIDEDLILLDNIKLLGVPNAIYMNMNLLALCTQGRANMVLNGETYEIVANYIFICPPEMTIDSVMISPDFQYQAVCMTNRLLQVSLNEYINTWNQLVYIQKIRILKMEEADRGLYTNTYNLLREWLSHNATDAIGVKYRSDIIKGLISMVLIGFCYGVYKQFGVNTETKQNVSLFNRFLELLQTTTAKHHTVDYYAEQLCISAKYLTIICKKNSGKTANEWIQEYKLSAITNYLRTTDMSVKEISNVLGFPNTSFFGKYVRDHLGCSPLEYRNKMKEGK